MSLGRALALLIVTSIAVFAIGAMDSDGDRLIHVTPDRLEAEASPAAARHDCCHRVHRRWHRSVNGTQA